MTLPLARPIPPRHSLLVDGRAEPGGDDVVLVPGDAVLHRSRA